MGINVYVGQATIPSQELAGLTIAEENALAGDASGWSISGVGDSANQGFCREFSVNRGETANFSCTGNGTVIDVYRIGWYGGDGWRLVETLANAATAQPAAATIPSSSSATTCTGWSTTASWDVPADATSGLYVGVYRNSGQTNASYIPFVVRADDRPADVMYKTSDSTWALAYNYYNTPASPLTGRSYYGASGGFNLGNRAWAATYHRPIVTRGAHPVTYWLNAEAPMIRWMERNGFDVSYSASKDWRSTGPTMADCGTYVSCGHDEYWSVGMRARWEALRDAGKHLLFMSGNEVFWRTRFDDELGGSGDGDVQWCYKDTMETSQVDPVTWTGTWRDTRRPGGAEPESGLTGTFFRMNGIKNESMVMSSSDPPTDHVFWRDTTVPASGINRSLVVGFEADELDPQQPADSRTVLAQTSINIDGFYANDNGSDYTGNGTITWGVISQRYGSGAVVVGFGTCQWSWGLDATHDNGSDVTNTAMRQATLNLLTDLGATAETPMAGMTVPTPVSLDNYGLTP